jgi:iron uptake system component EfeO
MPQLRPLALTVVALSATALLSACSDGGDSDATSVAVAATDTTCVPASTALTAGAYDFDVTNDGSRTTEFYIYESDGQTVVGEVEDITPGATRTLSTDLSAGSYTFACKPGQSGDGIRGTLTVS